VSATNSIFIVAVICSAAAPGALLRRRAALLARFPIRCLFARTPRDFAKPSTRLAVETIGSTLS
jgi:hypothetical protein